MDKNSHPTNFSEPALCAACHTFYGNPQFKSLCYKCYKDSVANESQEKPLVSETVHLPINVKEEEEVTVKQADRSKCWACAKRAGSLGFDCRCGFVFCNKHRLPESHNCEFDFIADGKKQLAKNNPVVQSDKIQKI